MNYLLDTNVISELVARRPEQRVVAWVDGLEDERLYLSVITIGEIRKGIAKLPPSPRREDLRRWLEGDLLARFAGRIAGISTATMLAWGELTGRLERAGVMLPAIDSLIAAIVLEGGFTLVTRNDGHFRQAGVPVVNPWQP
ncbi:MAG: type II toxin-antitoxin system VapC family toxin [Chloroflexi bacterium OHK40]